MAIEVCPPDVLISLPYDSFHGVDGYSRAREIADIGRALTSAALDRFEGRS